VGCAASGRRYAATGEYYFYLLSSVVSEGQSVSQGNRKSVEPIQAKSFINQKI
jgi:hypothetical protein